MFSLRYPHYGEIIRIPVTIGITVRNVTMIGMQFSALTLMFTFLFDIDSDMPPESCASFKVSNQLVY